MVFKGLGRPQKTGLLYVRIRGIFVTWSRETVPNCTSGKIELTPPAGNCTIIFQPKLWSTYSRLIVAGVNSRWCERLKWQVQAVASVWAGYTQCCCFFEQTASVHTVDCASFQALRSQHSRSRLVFGLHKCPTTILNCNLFPPVQPLPPTQWKHPWYYLARPTI